MTILELAKETAKILDNKKGLEVKLIGIEDVSSLADYMVLATGTSSTHVKSLADDVEFALKKIGVNPHNVEGHRSNSWILLDYQDVIVHVFSKEAREFYDLDRLWKDGKEIELSH